MSHLAWSPTEINLVRHYYPLGGVDACLRVLARTRTAIYQQARRMRLRAPGYTGVRRRYPRDAQLDEAVRVLHERVPSHADIAAFAARHDRPLWWVSKRAREMGLTTPRFGDAPWTPTEVDLLEQFAHMTPTTVRNKLAAAGFQRSATAIVVKRKRLGLSRRQSREDAGIYTARQVAELLGLDRKTPTRWHRREGLPATSTTDGRLMIRTTALRHWLIDHPFHVDLRKIPASSYPWFLDIVAGRA